MYLGKLPLTTSMVNLPELTPELALRRGLASGYSALVGGQSACVSPAKRVHVADPLVDPGSVRMT